MVSWAPPHQSDEIIILFAVLSDNHNMDEELEKKLKKQSVKNTLPVMCLNISFRFQIIEMLQLHILLDKTHIKAYNNSNISMKHSLPYMRYLN